MLLYYTGLWQYSNMSDYKISIFILCKLLLFLILNKSDWLNFFIMSNFHAIIIFTNC